MVLAKVTSKVNVEVSRSSAPPLMSSLHSCPLYTHGILILSPSPPSILHLLLLMIFQTYFTINIFTLYSSYIPLIFLLYFSCIPIVFLLYSYCIPIVFLFHSSIILLSSLSPYCSLFVMFISLRFQVSIFTINTSDMTSNIV